MLEPRRADRADEEVGADLGAEKFMVDGHHGGLALGDLTLGQPHLVPVHAGHGVDGVGHDGRNGRSRWSEIRNYAILAWGFTFRDAEHMQKFLDSPTYVAMAEKLRKEQAVMGLNARRQKIYLDNRFERAVADYSQALALNQDAVFHSVRLRDAIGYSLYVPMVTASPQARLMER